MRQVIQDEKIGTGNGYNIEGFDMAAKTGTGEVSVGGSYGNDISTSNIMAAAPADDPKILVYYGFQSPATYVFDKTYYKNLFTAAYEAAGIRQTNTTQTETNYENWQEFEMPALKNHSIDYVENKLKDLTVRPVYIGDGDRVIDQYPKAESLVSTNQNVFILTNSTNYTLPNMINWSYRDVMIYQELTGLNIVCNGSGVVVSQSVSENSSVSSETEIILELK